MLLNDNNGFMSLLTILVVGAVGVLIVTTFSLLAIDASRTGFALEQSFQAKALSNACAEEALQQISDSVPFSGAGTLSLGEGDCGYDVTALSGQSRTLDATGVVDTIMRKVDVRLDAITPNINITSWQEVADF